jgi:uronate dehydrogenase
VNKKTVLLTGAAGRVGRLIQPLLREHYTLRLCDQKPIPGPAPRDECIQGDLSDLAVAEAAVAGTYGVIHMAGLVAPAVSFEDTLAPNYRAMLALLEACRRAEVRRFVYGSSHHVLGLHGLGPMPSEAPLSPDGFYALSKVFGEAACALYSHRFGMEALIIRIGNADPEVVDGRRERLWVSERDLVQLIVIGLEHERLGCTVVYGVSNCPDPVFANEQAIQLGYRPLDWAVDHRAANFRSLAAMSASEGSVFVGGQFAAVPLPDPLVPTRSD